MPAFARATLGRRGWSWRDRLALLRTAAGWARGGFACPPATHRRRAGGAACPRRCARDLIEPLCVAALNTPAEAASGSVFLRVLRDALCCRRRRVGPAAAAAWPERPAAAAGARRASTPPAPGDPARASGRGDRARRGGRSPLAGRRRALRRASWSPPARSRRRAWWRRTTRPGRRGRRRCATSRSSRSTRAAPARACPSRCSLLPADDDRPAQFVFDRGRLGGPAGLLAFVVSGAASWVARGLAATEAATLAQARDALGRAPGRAARSACARSSRSGPPSAARRCSTGRRASVAAGLAAAGDYVDGPYPATLEGAVRSGTAAARSLLSA